MCECLADRHIQSTTHGYRQFRKERVTMAYIWIRNVMRSSRTSRRVGVTIAALIIGGLPLGTLHAETRSMDVVRSSPKPNDVVDGSMVSVHLCFEAPVDHERSTLTLRSRDAVRQLRPRLEAATDCLFSIVGRLAPGDYDLVWEARLSDGQTDSGTIPFSVMSSQARSSDKRVSRIESDGYQQRPDRGRTTNQD
jgi:methionine-rich copper-binding protein CopC